MTAFRLNFPNPPFRYAGLFPLLTVLYIAVAKEYDLLWCTLLLFAANLELADFGYHVLEAQLRKPMVVLRNMIAL